MSEHETIRELLSLASAGALDSRDASRIEQHTRECEACRRDLEIWSLYTQGLGRLPQPAVPLGLMERTRVRIIESHTAAAARRTDVLMLATLSLFCWIAFLVVWVLIHTL